ncbi:MAG: response regulator [Burkholderiaceae bacterium]
MPRVIDLRHQDIESRRLKRLHELAVLDTSPEAHFDAIANVASNTCERPIALVSFVDESRQWFKANVGLGEVSQTPRAIAFCSFAIDADGPLFEIPDARQDVRFAANPLVTNAPRIRHYAGAPITLSDGLRMGTVCVISPSPGRLLATQAASLVQLATIAAALLEARPGTLSTVMTLDGPACSCPSGRLEDFCETARSRSRLLAGIAHEMANRLHVILGLNHLMRIDTAGERDHEPWFDSVEEAGEQLLQGIRRVLALSHLGIASDVDDQPPTDPPAVVESNDALPGLTRDHQGAVVLLVDDDPDGLALGTGLLERAGLTVTSARHGGEAVRVAECLPLDLILMDLHMPVMDGWEAARAIRALPRHQRTPIVAYTSDDSEQVRLSCANAGFDGVLQKPARPATLARTFAYWLAAGKGRRI